MARNTYPLDEFDALPKGSPAGVHRRTPRSWTRIVIFLAILFTGVGLGWGVARLYLIADDVPWLNWLRGAFDSEVPQVTPDPVVVTPPPAPSPSPSPTPTFTLVLEATIVVYNDSGIAGLAAEVQALIQGENAFASVSAADWGGAAPPANAIRYSSEEFESTALYLASLLGITSVSIGPTEGSDIEIVLIADVPRGPEPSPSVSPSATP